MQLQSGTYLQGDKYRIIKSLGNGGFGITYLAEHELAGRNVCIKEFFPKEYYNRDDDSRNVSLGSNGSAEMMGRFKEKFIKEAKTIARLDHPNIIHIHDVFVENNTAYYVMEYIEGESLGDVVRRCGPLAEKDAVEYIRAVASALDYIHQRRIMHLDIKPANVMLRKEDNRAILIDFGLSKQYDAEGNQTSSTPLGISAGYAPMEQYQQGGVQEFSPETDIYSLGAALYNLVTGSVPPQAAVIVDSGIPALPAHLSSGVRNAIERAMEVQRRRRPHSVKEFLALLDGDGEATILPPQQPLTPPSEDTIITPPVKEQPKVEPRKAEQPKPTPTNPKKRSKLWLWLLLLLVAVGGVVGYMMSGGDEPEPTPTPTYEPITETVWEAEAVIEEQSEESTAPAETVVVEPTPAPTFTLAKSSLTVGRSSGSYSVSYTIENPIDGASVSVSDNYSWITNLSASGGKITFKTTDNTSAESRTGTITAIYNGITRQISIMQVHTYSIGDYYNENGKRGVVFQVWDGGRHGKIISLDETQAAWDLRVIYLVDNGWSGGTRTYADSESDGKANTDKIMSRSDSEYFDAFEWCRAKGSSWYLPAKDELVQIYNNKDKLNSTLRQYGTALSDGFYWSSTESAESCAWGVRVVSGNPSDFPKACNLSVRAVSAF